MAKPETRSFIRHPADIPIEVRCGPPVSGPGNQLNNISHGGVCFSSRTPWKNGSLIRLRIPVVEPAFEASGKVIWCRREDDHFEVGVEFLDREDVYKARMVEQVCHIEHYKHKVLTEEGRELSGREAAMEWIRKYAARFPQPEERDES